MSHICAIIDYVKEDSGEMETKLVAITNQQSDELQKLSGQREGKKNAIHHKSLSFDPVENVTEANIYPLECTIVGRFMISI